MSAKVEKQETWNCPLCYKRCQYGTMGCNDPTICDEPKNIHYQYYHKEKQSSGKGIGISEIAEKGK